MASKWETIAIPLVGGIDTSYDESATPVARLHKLVNAHFNKQGAIEKRPGYEKYGDIHATDTLEPVTDPAKSLVTRRDEVLKLTKDTLYSYIETRDEWSEVGPVVPMAIGEETIAADTGEQTKVDVASAAGLTVYAWEDDGDGLVVSVFDSSGRRINRFVANASGTEPQVVSAGDYIHVLFHDGTNIDKITITTSNAATVTSSDAANFLTTVTAGEWTAISAKPQFPEEVGPGEVPSANYLWYVAYINNSNEVVLARFTEPGASESTTKTNVGSANFKLPGVAVNDTYWAMAWMDDTTGLQFSSGTTSGSLGNGTFTASTKAHAHGSGDVKNLAVGITSDSNFCVYWTENSGSNYEENQVYQYSYSITNSLSPTGDGYGSWQLNASLGGKPFTSPEGHIHVPLKCDSGPLKMQNTLLLYRDPLRVSGVVVDGSTYGRYNENNNDLIGHAVNGFASDFVDTGFLPNTNFVDANTIILAVTTKNQVNAANKDKYGGESVRLVTFDYSHKPQEVPSNDSTLVASGLVYEYDGVDAVESGFVFWPEMEVDYTSTALGDHADVTEGGGASSMTAGTYGYKLYYEWTDANGVRQRSTAVAFSVALAGSLTVSLVVPNLHHTRKSDVHIVGYRTAVNGSIYYRFTSTDPTAGTGDNGYFPLTANYSQTITDAMADSDLIYNEIDPLTGGVLDHTLPLAGKWITGTDRRVFMAGGTCPESTVYYSKLRNNDTPAEFFDGLSLEIDKKGGAITGLGVLNDNLVVFKNNHIFMVGGTGPNNNGFGDFNKPFEVATTVGCNNGHTVVLTPLGLMFQSDKGFYLLQNNYSVQYIGAPAEDFSGQVHSATVIPDDDLVVFLAESGETVVYNFQFNQWCTYDNHLGLDSVLVGDDYYYVNSAGDVLRRTPDAYSDAGSGYSLKLMTAPLRFQGLQNYWRARELRLLGRYHSDHDLNVRVWYNREDYPSEDKTYDVSQFSSDDTWGEPSIPKWSKIRNAEQDGSELRAAGDRPHAFYSYQADGDFEFTWSISNLGIQYNIGIVEEGTTEFDDQADWTHGVFLSAGSAASVYYESGTIVGVAVAQNSLTADYTIRRVGTTITYEIDGVVQYTSGTASSGPVFLSAGMTGSTTNEGTISPSKVTGFDDLFLFGDAWVDLENAEVDDDGLITATADDARATSLGVFEGDFDIEFNLDAFAKGVSTMWWGINGMDITNEDRTDIDHGFYIIPGGGQDDVYITEDGSTPYNYGPINGMTDRPMRIKRSGDQITYYVSDSLIYTSLATSAGTVQVYVGFDEEDSSGRLVTATGMLSEPVWGGWPSQYWGGDELDYQVGHRFGRQKVQAVRVEFTEHRPTRKGMTLNELALEYAPKKGLGRIGKSRKK